MAPKLAKLLAAIACGQCNGNGWLGSRVYAADSGTGPGTRSRDNGRRCPTCMGSGVQPMVPEDSAHV